MDHPVVSIVTPSFNRIDVVRETAESIFSQSYPHWEWMIVDDGSTDGSWDLFQSLKRDDSRVRVLRREREPKGACTCRNIGVAESSGSHLVFLDTDDLLSSNCLEARTGAARSMPEKDFIIFSMMMFHKRPDDSGLLWNIDNGKDDLERILYGDPVCQGTGTLWKKESFVRAGLWDETLLIWQDVELHARSLLKGMTYGKCLALPPDAYIRVSETSISRTGVNSKGKLESRIRVLTSIVQTMRSGDLFDKYRAPLRHLFTDVFMGAADSRQSSLANRLIDYDLEWGLFKPIERRWLRSYVVMQHYRLYKIGGLKSRLLGTIRTFVPMQKSNIGIMPYAQSRL